MGLLAKTSLGIFLSVLLALAGLGGCRFVPNQLANQGGGYTEIGNGGDFVRILLEEGRQYGAAIISRTPDEAFSTVSAGSLSHSERNWLVVNRARLAQDVRSSRHIWVETLPEGCPRGEAGCAIAPGIVLLARSRCQQGVRNRKEAALLLIHESLHHLAGNDESKINRLTAAVHAAWQSLGHPEVPHWQTLSPLPRQSNEPFSYFDSAWTGTELVVWNDEGILRYTPAKGSWTTVTPTNRPSVWVGEMSSNRLLKNSPPARFSGRLG